jgi:hypothetical protein
MKREMARMAALLPLLALPLWGCADDPAGIEEGAFKPPAASTQISPSWAEVVLDPFHPSVGTGEAIRLTACWKAPGSDSLWPVTGASNVTWSSSDPDVATVTEEGMVEGQAHGLVRITVTVTFKYGGLLVHTYSGSTPVGVR